MTTSNMTIPNAFAEIVAQGHPLRFYYATTDPFFTDLMEKACGKLAVECHTLSADEPFSVKERDSSVEILRDGGFVVVVLDLTSLGEKALKLRDFWHDYKPAEHIPFFYYYDCNTNPINVEPMHGYEETAPPPKEVWDIEVKLQLTVLRFDWYRRQYLSD